MRWGMKFVVMLMLGTLWGCGRIQTEEVSVVAERPTAPRLKVEKPKEVEKPPPMAVPSLPSKEAAPTAPAPQPIEEGAETPVPSAPKAPPSTPSAVVQPAPQPSTAAVSPTTVTPAPTPTPLGAAPSLTITDETRNVRAGIEVLWTQFDRLKPNEARARLLLFNQALSELEVQSPALVLWRTALRLEALSQAAMPNVATAKLWLARAKELLTPQGLGLTALSDAEKALVANNWKEAIAALQGGAQRLNAVEQANALAQARVCLLNALDAIERQKFPVAKAELGEALKVLDKLLGVLP